MIKVFTVAHLPADLAHAWLQHLRDFDVRHPGCHFELAADAPEFTIAEMIEMIRLDPALTFTEVIRRGAVMKGTSRIPSEATLPQTIDQVLKNTK